MTGEYARPRVEVRLNATQRRLARQIADERDLTIHQAARLALDHGLSVVTTDWVAELERTIEESVARTTELFGELRRRDEGSAQ